MAKRGINLLDDLQIKRWIAAGEPVAKSDGGGLTFTLSKAGTATFVLRYMRAGRPKELTVGNYPDLTLAVARKLAREKRVDIDQGGDPAADKKREKMRTKMAWTINNLSVDYLEKHLVKEKYAVGTIYYRKWDLDHIIKPKLGSLEVQTITPADIVHLIESTKRSWTINKRILTSTSKLFDHAIGKRLITINPCAGVKLSSLMGPRPAVKRRIMLTEPELKSVLANIEEIGQENALAFKILLTTCVRSRELAQAKWSEIDFDKKLWVIPDDHVKVRTGILIPLTPTVESWFRQLQTLAGDSAYVLPARGERRTKKYGDTHVSFTTLWAAITRAFNRGDIEARKFTPHDTRSTAKGHMRNLGISREASELALNHKLKGMEGIYDVREDIPERSDALEKWAEFVDSCK
jgi:integrase